MKIINENPPDWIMSGCLNKFRVDASRTFWTYGDTLYNPGSISVPDHILVHEETHSKQQEEYHYDGDDESLRGSEGKDAWWRRYLSDARFRLEQEAMAYGMQYAYFCLHQTDRNKRFRFLINIAGTLSGPLYQVAITRQQAKDMIEVLSGKKRLMPKK